jgi:hypothetical protein
MYVDVLRTDRMIIKTIEIEREKWNNTKRHLPIPRQRFTLHPKQWNDKDGFDGTEETEDLVETGNRDFELIKLVPPEETNFEDPDEWVPLRMAKRVKLRDSSKNTNRRFLSFLTSRDTNFEGRLVESVRICYRETNFDEEAEGAANNGQKVFHIADVQEYERDEESKDEEIYIEYDIIKRFRGRLPESYEYSTGANLSYKFHMKNQFLIDIADGPAQREEEGPNNANPPWRIDPLQNVVNVSWGGKAVEFENGENLTVAETLPNHSQAVGCMWFRLPSETYYEAKAEYDAWNDDDDIDHSNRPPFMGIIPLMTVGPKARHHNVTNELVDTGRTLQVQEYIWSGNQFPPCTAGDWQLIDQSDANPINRVGNTALTDPQDDEPTHIGINVMGDEPKLSIQLTLPHDNLSESTNVYHESELFRPSVLILYVGLNGPCTGLETYDRDGIGACDTFCVRGVNEHNIEQRHYDISEIFEERVSERFTAGDGIAITLDHWHCVVFSYDVDRQVKTRGAIFSSQTTCASSSGGGVIDPNTEGQRTLGAIKMHLAFDDENKTKKQLSGYWPGGYHSDPNAVLSQNGYYVANYYIEDHVNGPEDDCFGNTIMSYETGLGTPTYQLDPQPLPTSEVQMAFPAATEFSDYIRRVQMGPFQIFLDVTANTVSREIRRLFVTDEGKPAPFSAAKEYFGKDPEIAFKRSSDWISGKNVGSLRTSQDPEARGVIVGEIEKYTPNPNLYGNQGE